MKLAAKLMIFLVVGIVAVLATDTWYTIHRDRELLENELQRDTVLLGDAMRRLVGHAREAGGEDYVRAVVSDVNRIPHRVSVRWFALDASFHDSRLAALDDKDRARLRQGQEVLSYERSHHSGTLYAYFPVELSAHRTGVIEIIRSLDPVREMMLQTVRRSIWVGVIIATLGAGLSVGVGMLFVGRPLDRLSDKVRRVGKGDLGGAVHLHGHDELSALAEGINNMCRELTAAQQRTRRETAARIEALEQLRHRDRLTTVGRLASGVAHELGTPLNVIAGRAGMIAKAAETTDKARASAAVINDQCDRMTGIIEQLLHFARQERKTSGSADLAELSRQVAELVEPMARKQDVTISVAAYTAPVMAAIGSGEMQQVLTNLLVNALQASRTGGHVWIAAAATTTAPPPTRDRPEAEYACVEVRDDGIGIAPEHVQHVFEPFYTTKDVGEGTGLGLSIAYGIVRDHGGWIDVSSEPGKGARFSVFLPLENSHDANHSDRG